ncbi:MAG TPA: hypothetical protein VGN17_03295 [Bryobacteraceae bacterium]|jgi:hypothetical protein
MLLTDFFHESDFTLGVFYPRHCITAVFQSIAPAERAEAALRQAEFEADHVVVASGRDVLDYDRDHITVFRAMMRAASRFFVTEQSFNDEDLEQASHGAGFLIVRCPHEAQKAEAWKIIKKENPLDARYYGIAAIEHLAGDPVTD